MKTYLVFLFSAVCLLLACQSNNKQTAQQNNVPTNSNTPIAVAPPSTQQNTTESAAKPKEIPTVLPMPNGKEKEKIEERAASQQRITTSAPQKEMPKNVAVAKTETVTTVKQQTTKMQQQPELKTPPIVAQ